MVFILIHNMVLPKIATETMGEGFTFTKLPNLLSAKMAVITVTY